MDRKLFMMKGFHHPKGSQQAFLRGLAHPNLVIISLPPVGNEADRVRDN
jgi:hypothetical protein